MVAVTKVTGRRNTHVIVRYRNRNVNRTVITKHKHARQHSRPRLTVVRRVRERLRMCHLIPVLLRFSYLYTNVMNSTTASGVVRNSNRVRVAKFVVLVLSNRHGHIQALGGRKQSAMYPRRQTSNVRTIKMLILIFKGSLPTLLLLSLFHFRVNRDMLFNSHLPIASHNSSTILSRRNADTMSFSNTRIVNSGGRNFNQVLFSLHRVVVTLTLRHLISGHRRLIRRRSIALYFSNRKRHRSSLRTQKVILRLLVRRLVGLHRVSSIIMRHISLLAERSRRNAVGMRVLPTHRFEVRSGSGLGR